MTEFFQFASENPWLTWALAWGIWPVAQVLVAPFKYGFQAYNRRLRSQNIARRGWPTQSLMDADGDIVHPPENEE